MINTIHFSHHHSRYTVLSRPIHILLILVLRVTTWPNISRERRIRKDSIHNSKCKYNENLITQICIQLATPETEWPVGILFFILPLSPSLLSFIVGISCSSIQPQTRFNYIFVFQAQFASIEMTIRKIIPELMRVTPTLMYLLLIISWPPGHYLCHIK